MSVKDFNVLVCDRKDIKRCKNDRSEENIKHATRRRQLVFGFL